jgi:molybdopterin synthase catalytic subunit
VSGAQKLGLLFSLQVGSTSLAPSIFILMVLAGTTRDNFGGKPVKELQYTSYEPRALQTMLRICKDIKEKHSLTSIAMIHRLGVVPIGEESILIAVSSAHRQASWRAGEEALEECKEKVEVWKKEEFGGDEGGIWRANRDGLAGVRIDQEQKGSDNGPPAGPHGQILRLGRPGERGHGPVVHPNKLPTT